MSIEIGALLVTALAALGLLHHVLPKYLAGARYYSRGWNDPGVWAMLYGYLLFFGVLPSLVGLSLGATELRRSILSREGVEKRESALIGVALNLAFLAPSLSLYISLCRGGYFRFVLGSLPLFLDIPMPQGGSLT